MSVRKTATCGLLAASGLEGESNAWRWATGTQKRPVCSDLERLDYNMVGS